MCGITGILNYNGKDNLETLIRSMTDTMILRGPDSSDIWKDGNKVALGHRRLSIQDVSLLGLQPMESKDKKNVVVYNGEIYNFKEIKYELEKKGREFIGGSDTEVLIEAISYWGIEKSLEKFIGMFAFCLYDKNLNKGYLVRDRLGIKPLYYGVCENTIIFGSELKALKKYTKSKFIIDNDGVALYLKHNYIAAPNTIYKNIFKVEAGTYIEIDLKTNDRKVKKYWDLDAKIAGRKKITDIEISKMEIKKILEDSIRLRMRSDVNIGAFLSGGTDSTLVSAIMQKKSEKPINTFSIGFEDDKYNEADKAKLISEYIGTNHKELYINRAKICEYIVDIPKIYDEPFADASQIPTYIVSKLAADNSVKVCLSGDGGDELFYGYERYDKFIKIHKRLNQIPYKLRCKLCDILKIIPSSNNKIKRLETLGRFKDHEDLYERLISLYENVNDILVKPSDINMVNRIIKNEDVKIEEKAMFIDSKTYMQDDILTKVDRASMAASVEARVPILDHRLFELALDIDLTLKKKGKINKFILKEVLYDYIPKRLCNTPKKGFSIPINEIIRHELKDICLSLLNEERIINQGIFKYDFIEKMIYEHMTLKREHGIRLWGLIVFQMWIDLED